MKLATFIKDDVPQIGAVVVETGAVVPLQANHREMTGADTDLFQDMLSFLRGGEQARALASEILDSAAVTIPMAEVSLRSPVPRPESIRDCISFEQHIINCIRKVGLKKLAPIDEAIERWFGRKRSIAGRMNRAWYERPVYYKSNRFSVIGHGETVIRPSYTDQLDYELEWGVFIGKQGKDIPKERAGEHIGGYVVFNDFSARDIQLREQAARLGPAKGKDFDTGNAIGPWLVTPDEVASPYELKMTAEVNGEEWSRGTTGDMHWTFEEIIAHVSMSETLYPGEFIGSGTCSGEEGMGCGLEMGRFLSPGDTVTLTVDGIGTLTNRIAAG
jgi:2-keto-4-pentenoate hydratase/2-oxohepta-3-ene-1,7-dioic acid hydratase in catechol pathway